MTTTRGGKGQARAARGKTGYRGAISLDALSAWTSALARTLTAERPEHGMAELSAGFTHLVPHAHVFCGILGRNAVPVLFDHKDDPWDRNYLLGGYLLDPLYEQFLKRNANVLLSPGDMYPENFEDQRFYQDYYQPYGWRDKISYLIYLRLDTAAFVTLARHTNEPPFTKREFKLLEATLPGVEKAAYLWWSQSGFAGADQAESRGLHRVLHATFSSFGDDKLSAREREVTRLLLKGLPPKAVGKRLSIAPGTVRNHVKHIYAKLNVRSQAGLLALLFDTLECAAREAAKASDSASAL